MKKSDFLIEVFSRFLELHPRWTDLIRDKRGLYFAAGRELPGATLIYVDFSVRPDNLIAGHGVGWTRSIERFHDARSSRTNPPIQPRDGSLRRIATLDDPRDFHYEELRVATAALCKPFGGFDLGKEDSGTVIKTILLEIETYAFPYLCLMLAKRHKIVATPFSLGNGDLA